MYYTSNKGAAVFNPRKAFRIHFLIFLLSLPVTWIAWYFTPSLYPWPLWSNGAWAIGILFHYLFVYVFKSKKVS